MTVKRPTFLTNETGSITLDWFILTIALVGTGICVMATLTDGVEMSSLSTTSNLRGQVVRASFEGQFCRGGVAALQAQEDARVASGGGGAIEVTPWMADKHPALSDSALRAKRDQLIDATRHDSSWTRDRTILTALECEMVLRGLD